MTERDPADQAVADRHPDITQQGLPIPVTEYETRAGVTARIDYDAEGTPTVACAGCGAALVDDQRSPFYDAATDNGLPHECGGVLL